MYVDRKEVELLERKYGPVRRTAIEPVRMLEWEYGLLKSSGRNGRRHDVTMFIRKSGDSGRYVCIQKHFYKDTGIFRAPSGGVHRGESIERGLKREMLEETGLEVAIDSFPLITETEFISPDGSERVPWTSYIFTGHDIGGALNPLDKWEISALGLFRREELTGPIAEIMQESGWGGFLYRVKLTEETFSVIGREAE